MAGNRNSGMCSPLWCVCVHSHFPQGIKQWSTKRLNGIRAKVERTKKRVFRKFYLSTDIFPLFSPFLIARKAVKSYIASLVATLIENYNQKPHNVVLYQYFIF